MSKKDELTGKKSLMGNTRSHAMNHSRRAWQLNLQTAKIKNGKSTKTVKVTAKTMKTLKKQNKLA
ncbi:MAG: 50S ribosomal protein L28 [Mycoplasmataceae bacterium]|jgi:large subunit ribosomal protein L28|nr:50S ribosomal protein L28 [Mycoplasmataceae bacterium]